MEEQEFNITKQEWYKYFKLSLWIAYLFGVIIGILSTLFINYML